MYLDPEESTAFDEYLASARSPREGYWSPFVTLAWIISRSDRVVAAVQIYEEAHHANRGGGHTWSARLLISDKLEQLYGRGLPDAERDLREKAQDNQLPGATARYSDRQPSRQVERREWKDWRRAFENYGLELVPGLYDFGFPSDEVRSAFPSDYTPPGEECSPVPVSASDRDAALRAWADDAVARKVVVKDARKDAKLALGKLAPAQDECRAALKQARARIGIETRPGRPEGSKSFAKARTEM